VGAAGILTFDPAANTCATQCHKNTLPVWGSSTTGSCGTCHSVAPAFNIGFSPAANQPLHDFHFSGSNNGPKLSAANATGCQVCHFFTDDLGATHNNGSVNLNTGYGTVNTACGTCHKQTTNWVNARVTCESCHSTAGGALSVINGKTAPDKTTAATLGHGKPSINQACTICHNRDSQHIGVNGGTTRLFAKYSSSAAGAGCNTCHNNSAVVATASMQNMKVHRLSGLGSTCSDCHNPHGTANSMMVETAINGVAVSYSGKGTFANAAGTGVCQACHTNTIYFTKNNSPAPQQHVDSTEDCTSCHKHNPTDGSRAFSAPGNCDSCHGYPPAPRNVAGLIFGKQGQWSSARFEDYSGGGGAHIVGAHIPATAKASDGWANCTPCHKNASASHLKVLPIRNHVENITVSVDPQLRFSNDAQATYTSAKLVSAGANRTGSCFNVNCHFKTTLKWSSER
jgi:nitrate/TMAO reductase-like tetraheme cytochrome c subunit